MTGNELIQKRKSMQMTQAQLAKILGVSTPRNPGKKISEWERNLYRVPAILDLALCEFADD